MLEVFLINSAALKTLKNMFAGGRKDCGRSDIFRTFLKHTFNQQIELWKFKIAVQIKSTCTTVCCSTGFFQNAQKIDEIASVIDRQAFDGNGLIIICKL